MDASVNRFNVRVYFLLFHPQEEKVLVSDEIIAGRFFTKFPGGGLEFGEGTRDAALREAREELGQEIIITGHFYTTDFFVRSAFRTGDQVISIYYTAELPDQISFRTTEKVFDFLQQEKNEESFRWISAKDLREDEFHFPIDRTVAGMLRESFQAVRRRLT